jgi:hypothetical protein
VEDVVNRLFGVIRDSTSLKINSWDPERTSELYYMIAKGFLDSPDLKIAWLENLAKYHQDVSKRRRGRSFVSKVAETSITERQLGRMHTNQNSHRNADCWVLANARPIPQRARPFRLFNDLSKRGARPRAAFHLCL